MGNTSSIAVAGRSEGPEATDAPAIGSVRADMASILAHTAEFTTGLRPDDLPVSSVPPMVEQLLLVERWAASARLLLTATAVESERWKRDGFASPAAWLAKLAGCGVGRAKQDIETSHRLRTCRRTAAAVRDGRLSPDQAAAITDAATLNPDAEDDLIETAQRESLKHLRDEAARRKAEREDLDEKSKRIRRERCARTWIGRDGAWNLSARGPVEDGAGFEVDWNRFVTQQFEMARREGRAEVRDQYAFDALMTMGKVAGGSGGESADGEADGERSTPRLPKAENLPHLALIRVDLDTLIRGSIDDGDTCEIGGTTIAVSAIRALLGESICKLVITRGVDVANVTHLGRGVTVAQQVALLWSQPWCTREGCNHRARLENDHRHDWALDHVTELHNVDRLCEPDHDLKTNQGWALVAGTGRRPMVPPDHPDHPRNRGRP